MGVGAVVGGLVTATRGRTGLRPLTVAAALFGVAILIAALSPMLAVAFVAMAAVGWTSVSFLATGNSTLQLAAKPAMRGRVMALWAVAFLGSTPIGGPLIGWIVAIANARVGLAVGGASALVAAGIGVAVLARLGLLGAKRVETDGVSQQLAEVLPVADMPGERSEVPPIAV